MVTQRNKHLLPVATAIVGLKLADSYGVAAETVPAFGNSLELQQSTDVLGGPPLDAARNGLREVLVQPDLGDLSRSSSWSWLCSCLDRCIREDWEVVLAPALKDLSDSYPRELEERRMQLAKVYKVLTIIVGAIKVRGDVSLDGIVSELHIENVLKATSAAQFQAKQNLFRQMVWCLTGLVTMLYEPQRQRPEDKLELRRSASTLRGMGMRNSRNLSFYQHDINDSQNTLHDLLRQFGNLIPLVEVDADYLSGIDYDYINVAYINFSTLRNVAKLDIEWVDTLNLHLKLDKRRRVLQLFRFPAFCQLLWTDTEDSFMQKLYADYCRTQVKSEHENVEYTMSDYLREIMLSYRLLFGIDKSSRQAFKSLIQDWQTRPDSTVPQNIRSPTLPTGFPITPVTSRPQSRPGRRLVRQEQAQLKVDPILLLLCTTENQTNTSNMSNNQEQLAELLTVLRGEEKTSTLYDLEDFPFLGRRLHDLERFSRIQKPNDWKSVFWIDRRDSASFWNSMIACALLFIGGGTIVLQFFQLVFQIWGTVLAKQSSPN